jgi:hypothetical protein
MRIKLETTLINFLTFILLWLSFLKFGAPPSVALDPSWMLVLAYVFKHNLQAGIDYVITYGPLGCFTQPNMSYYDADVFDSFVIWWVVVGCSFAILFLMRASQLHNRIEKWLYLFLVIVVLSVWSGDPLYLLAMITITLLVIHPPTGCYRSARYFILLGIALFLLALFPLTKFSFFFLDMICLLGILMHIGYKYSYRTALKVLTTFILIFLGVWTLLGQSPLNIPAFILNSLQIASSYDEAMSYEPSDPKEYYFALSGISLVSMMILLSCLSKPRQLARFISGTIIFCGLFLAWKAGFVRHDAHAMTFFNVLAVLPFFIHRPPNMKILSAMVFSVLLVVSVFMGLTGIFYVSNSAQYNYTSRNFIGIWNEQVVNNLTTLNSLTTFKAGRDAAVAQLQREYALPNIQATVKQATVDVFPPEIAVALLNGLNYHPRPIFQSYSAYNDKLLALNAKFYTGTQAPEFVLFKITPIDGRFPLAEDSQVLRILLRDYQPVLVEKGYVLLKRNPRGSGLVVNTKKPLLTQTVKFGENVDISHLSDKNLTLSLDIRKSLLGRFTKLFFKLPEVYFAIQTTDGASFTYRIIPNVVKSDFIFNPLILNESDWLAWHDGKPTKRIANFRVLLNPQWSLESKQLECLFQPEVVVRVSENEVTPLRK